MSFTDGVRSADLDVLRGLLAPVEVADFFSKVWCRRSELIPGAAGRFDSLLDWEEFVRVLTTHWADLVYPRMRLVQDGKVLNRDVSKASSRTGPVAGRTPLAQINELCARGASIVVSSFDDYSGRLRTFRSKLELELRNPVSINAYYTPVDSKAFHVHYDPYDVLILQVLGQKHWKLFGFAPCIPLLDDTPDFQNPPEHPRVEHVLTEGDVLYVPRGCWHAARTCQASASLHLTVGIRSHTYMDLLGLLIERLKNVEVARSILPISLLDSGLIAISEERIRVALDDLLQQARELLPEALQELEGTLGKLEEPLTIQRP